MRDDYKWYNSVYFNQREEKMKNWPEEKCRLDNDERMIPHIKYEQEEIQKKVSSSKSNSKFQNNF